MSAPTIKVANRVQRSCSRCGNHFYAENVCEECRIPKYAMVHFGVALTHRECEVVKLIGQAKTNKEIAYELCLTYGTIKQYISQIFKKLNVTNRTEIAILVMNSQHNRQETK